MIHSTVKKHVDAELEQLRAEVGALRLELEALKLELAAKRTARKAPGHA